VYIELSKPSFNSGLSTKDGRIAESAISQRQQVGLPAFSSHCCTCWTPKRESV